MIAPFGSYGRCGDRIVGSFVHGADGGFKYALCSFLLILLGLLPFYFLLSSLEQEEES